ncbi:MAG: hypothetical protein ACK5Q1_04675, partial [Limnobacter sp.]
CKGRATAGREPYGVSTHLSIHAHPVKGARRSACSALIFHLKMSALREHPHGIGDNWKNQFDHCKISLSNQKFRICANLLAKC